MVSELQAKKNFLYRYRNSIKDINELQEKIDFINAKMENLSSPGFSEKPGSTNSNTKSKQEKLIDRKIAIEKQILKRQRKSELIKDEIIQVIDEVHNPMSFKILESYFIDMKDVNEICCEIDRCSRQFYRLYKKAVMDIQLKNHNRYKKYIK